MKQTAIHLTLYVGILFVLFLSSIGVSYGLEQYAFLREWGSEGTGDGQFTFPASLDVDEQDKSICYR